MAIYSPQRVSFEITPIDGNKFYLTSLVQNSVELTRNIGESVLIDQSNLGGASFVENHKDAHSGSFLVKAESADIVNLSNIYNALSEFALNITGDFDGMKVKVALRHCRLSQPLQPLFDDGTNPERIIPVYFTGFGFESNFIDDGILTADNAQ